MKDWKIISVGGSIINPSSGFDISFLKKFRKFILDLLQKNERLILVVGGGDSARRYQSAAKQVTKLNNTELDWVGIAATEMNAKFVRQIFGNYAHSEVIVDPRIKVKTSKKLIIAAGWKPGCSTDYDTVLLAKTYGAKQLLNLSNIEYVYDKDPNKYEGASKIEEIDWKTFRKEVVGNKWVAGKNAPFDPVASREAEKLGLTVFIVQGTNLLEVAKAVTGSKFVGTTIHP